MPLYAYRCPSGHTVDLLRKMSEADEPTTCTCGAPMTRGVSMTAPIVVAGRSGPREGTFSATTDAFTTTFESDTVRVREKGSAPVVADWKCTACAHTWHDVYDTKPEASPSCTECGASTVEVPGIPDLDWFTKQYAATGGYFDKGLGRWITSLAHRRAVMDELGVVEMGEVGDITEDYQRRKRARADEEDREVRNMLRGFEHGPEAAGLKTARDRGQIKPWDWAIDAVGGLDKE